MVANCNHAHLDPDADALGLLKFLRDEKWCAPHDDSGKWPPSNGQLRRWLQHKSIQINNEFPSPEDKINFPVKDLVFFPKKSSRTCSIFGNSSPLQLEKCAT